MICCILCLSISLMCCTFIPLEMRFRLALLIGRWSALCLAESVQVGCRCGKWRGIAPHQAITPSLLNDCILHAWASINTQWFPCCKILASIHSLVWLIVQITFQWHMQHEVADIISHYFLVWIKCVHVVDWHFWCWGFAIQATVAKWWRTWFRCLFWNLIFSVARL